jgi:hypothetical protein
MLKVFFFLICLVSSSISFAMEEMPKKTIAIDLNASCSYCLDPLAVQKGSIITSYCGHSLHGLCYIQWHKSNKSCYCSSPLIIFDKEGAECLQSFNSFIHKSYMTRLFELGKDCSAVALKMIKHGYWTAHYMSSTAYHYNED